MTWVMVTYTTALSTAVEQYQVNVCDFELWSLPQFLDLLQYLALMMIYAFLAVAGQVTYLCADIDCEW